MEMMACWRPLWRYVFDVKSNVQERDRKYRPFRDSRKGAPIQCCSVLPAALAITYA